MAAVNEDLHFSAMLHGVVPDDIEVLSGDDRSWLNVGPLTIFVPAARPPEVVSTLADIDAIEQLGVAISLAAQAARFERLADIGVEPGKDQSP